MSAEAHETIIISRIINLENPMPRKPSLNGTVRALSRINFVVFSQLVGVELPRGVASIFVVPCKFE